MSALVHRKWERGIVEFIGAAYNCNLARLIRWQRFQLIGKNIDGGINSN